MNPYVETITLSNPQFEKASLSILLMVVEMVTLVELQQEVQVEYLIAIPSTKKWIQNRKKEA